MWAVLAQGKGGGMGGGLTEVDRTAGVQGPRGSGQDPALDGEGAWGDGTLGVAPACWLEDRIRTSQPKRGHSPLATKWGPSIDEGLLASKQERSSDGRTSQTRKCASRRTPQNAHSRATTGTARGKWTQGWTWAQVSRGQAVVGRSPTQRGVRVAGLHKFTENP